MKERLSMAYKKIPYIKRKLNYRKKIKAILEKNNIKKQLSSKYSNEIDNFWIENANRKIRKDWHLAYSTLNGIQDSRYVPEDVFYTQIEPTLNKKDLVPAYKDKNSYHIFLGRYPEPETLLKNKNGRFYKSSNEEINIHDAEKYLLNKEGEFFIKPSIDSGGGKAVSLIKLENQNIFLKNELISFKQLDELYKSDYLIQEKIVQHEKLKKIHPESLNTLRITTLKLEEEVAMLSTVARFGNKGEKVDNQASGGVSCGVDREGNLKKYAVDKVGTKFELHPHTNVKFEGVEIPSYELSIELVKKLHNKLPYFNMISWDIAIDINGDLKLLELNLQGQEINFHQFNNGPLFGEYTKSICELIKLS